MRLGADPPKGHSGGNHVKAYITSALAGAFLLGLATAAWAVNGEFGNLCAGVSQAVRRPKPTAPSMGSIWARPIASAARRPWACSCRTQRTISPRRRPTTHRSIPVRPCSSNALLAISKGVGFGRRPGVELLNDRDIVVSQPESGLSVTYRKDGDAPMLVAIEGIDEIDRFDRARLNFLVKARKAFIRRLVR